MSHSEPRAKAACRAPRRRLLLISTLSGVLSACALPALQPAPQAGQWRGRFSLSWTGAGAGEAAAQASGKFVLQADASRASLEVASPLGQVLAIASLGPEGARLVTADGQRHEAPDAEQLMLQVLGWPAPVQRLAQWLMLPAGCAAGQGALAAAGPGAPVGGGLQPAAGVTPMPAGATLRFEDSGWQVAVESWEDALPRRLLLRWPASVGESSGASAGAAAGSRSLSMRLIVDERVGQPPRPPACP